MREDYMIKLNYQNVRINMIIIIIATSEYWLAEIKVSLGVSSLTEHQP